jgi:hypothetical protein
MYYLALLAIIVGLKFLIQWTYAAVRWLVARPLTPKGHRLFGSYGDSKAAGELVRDAYSITADWRIDAYSRIPKAKKSP